MESKPSVDTANLAESNTATTETYNNPLKSLSSIREYLKAHPYCLISHVKASDYYRKLGYPDLAAGAAYKALLLADAIDDESDEFHDSAVDDLSEYASGLESEPRYSFLHARGSESLNTVSSERLVSLVLEEQRPLIYAQLISSLALCGCYKSAAKFHSQAKGFYPDHEALEQARNHLRHDVSKHFNISNADLDTKDDYAILSWPDSGYVRREVYPWNLHEPDRLQELDALNEFMIEVAPKLEVKVVDLPSLISKSDESESATVQQFGVFAKEDIMPGEVILDETSMLTANNRLQDALCDACSANLPALDSSEANETVQCQDCEVVFCSQECYDAAIGAYHRAICEMDVEAIAKDVPREQAAEALYSLLLLRAMAMAETQRCHPLDLREVKYIWGDFHRPPFAQYEYPMSDDFYRSNEVVKTLPFSFEHNIRLPFHMLEKMDIDIFANAQYDVEVFNTLYAKFRGTASARLSGSAGGAARGPEVGAVHPMWCLANHSCDPNVSWEWGGSIQFHVRDRRVRWKRSSGEKRQSIPGIKKGEEILNHYCDVDLQVHERREWMRGTLGGNCRCVRCVWEADET